MEQAPSVHEGPVTCFNIFAAGVRHTPSDGDDFYHAESVIFVS